MKKLNILAISALFILTACTSSQRYNSYIEPFVGVSEQELMAKLGQPDNVEQINGDTNFFSYINKQYNPHLKNRAHKHTQPITGEYNFLHAMETQQIKGNMFYSRCTTNFVVAKGYVVAYNFEGVDCGKSRK
tara:strand:- start:1354 stop:1749 length:396 start_codon:yes stop_codon:yes gene_type:complete